MVQTAKMKVEEDEPAYAIGIPLDLGGVTRYKTQNRIADCSSQRKYRLQLANQVVWGFWVEERNDRCTPRYTYTLV